MAQASGVNTLDSKWSTPQHASYLPSQELDVTCGHSAVFFLYLSQKLCPLSSLRCKEGETVRNWVRSSVVLVAGRHLARDSCPGRFKSGVPAASRQPLLPGCMSRLSKTPAGPTARPDFEPEQRVHRVSVWQGQVGVSVHYRAACSDDRQRQGEGSHRGVPGDASE